MSLASGKPMGGDSSSMKFSRMAESLSRGGVSAEHVPISTPSDVDEALNRIKPDLAFCSIYKLNLANGDFFYLRPYLLGLGCGWIGSSTSSLENALSKSRTKAIWRENGISTPDWFTVRKDANGDTQGMEKLEDLHGFPFIVKPDREGNSRGIGPQSIVRSPLELYSRASLVVDEYGSAIVERFVAGDEDSREFTVAMIGDGENSIVAAAEIRKARPDMPVITEGDKDGHSTSAVAIDDRKMKERVEDLARRVFAASGIRDYARCDILFHQGQLFAIEVNGQPMVPDLWFEACLATAGLDEAQYLNAIVLAGIVANTREGTTFISIPQEMKRLLPPSVFGRLVRPRAPA